MRSQLPADAVRPSTSRPIERAVPAMVRIAASMLGGVEIGHLRACAISRTCFLVTLPTLILFGSLSPSPASSTSPAAAFLSRIGAGGVLVMNVNERSRVDRDHDRDDQVVLRLRLRAGVELLAELHDVDAVLAERRPDGRRRVRLAGGNLELDETGDLLH